ncbi:MULTISPECIES: acyl carrier protein [Chryseobacterium]|jgi:Phosphopantetheine attachment site.|uniref:Acyl carrier protein n=2 Tax=Chryseobacterium TaxID=59732 RepID=A0AAE3YEB4_9FLAO|nr:MULTISPECIES: phosphopantetheine-binding protein [Chryseobacterium]MBL3547319.1 acyl carrier protein [Chryseobacterium sp. KMC2]MDC8099319.1 phosphopantetheine-binding protein [Chryseobacterium rhizosphaerae]MDR6528779.1 acyl carrier protein [Chryseobacterium rhizosphaerae]MDR6546265.1 acyl carrier protein [Chryseobacterium rhizosphaerae]REC75451.1 acyl carrier protein [Chryseobacterium rhizosphaerae]
MDTVNPTLKLNHEELFTLLKGFITEVIGAEFVEEMDITPESSFTKDLEMDSIEIVSFSEKIKAHFGDQIDFTGWLSSMDLDQLINLDLSMIINYIYECQ